MTTAPELSADQILGYRRRIGRLDRRMEFDVTSLRSAAWAGLQDSMPRAAVLSVHARVAGTPPDVWAHDAFVQVWGPRFSAFVVPTEDRGVFTLGRHPRAAGAAERAEDLAARIVRLLGTRSMTYSDAGRELGEHPNRLRYATTTGRVVIRWEGAGKPTIRAVEPPPIDVDAARRELVRRYLHVFGPSTPGAFAQWAGVKPADARATWGGMAPELTEVRTPIGTAQMLEADLDAMDGHDDSPAPVRLLPSGDSYYLLQGADRTVLVDDASRRDRLWTSRVWPGALLISGRVAGTWRRSKGTVSIEPWESLSASQREAVEAEAAGLPLPDVDHVTIEWIT